jgi:hypothetical protein
MFKTYEGYITNRLYITLLTGLTHSRQHEVGVKAGKNVIARLR